MIRTERHIVINNPQIDYLCFLSKNLYNYCNYIFRQVYFDKFELISEFKDLIKEFKYKDKVFYKIREFDLITRLTKMNQPDYRALPAHVSQQIIIQLAKNWKSFFKSLKSYYKNKNKFCGKPKLPKYKKKDGKNILIFSTCRLKDGFIHFPKKVLQPIKTKVDNLVQVRIIPQSSCYVIEVVYKKEKKNYDLNENLYFGIDLGLSNLATCVSNTGEKPFIANGKIVKSINQYYNKKKSFLQSLIPNKTSKRINRLTLKRNNKIHDYFHKTTRFIIDYCIEHKIKTIVIGKNKDWKRNIELGKRNNQNFVQIPFEKLINQLEYKAEEVGIKVILREESYTSKCSFLDFEKIEKHINYLGRRIKRGLFRSLKGILINADVNAAYNILRKEVPDLFRDGIEDVVLHPLRINFS